MEDYLLKEAILVKGSCSEDHVSQLDSYAGQIVRWQRKDTGALLTYGFVMRSLVNSYRRTLNEIMNPAVYNAPSLISFKKIDIDTNQPTWVLHGVSERGDDESRGYDSTCNVEVVERGNKLKEIADIEKALELR
jgi:hypothetical protein